MSRTHTVYVVDEIVFQDQQHAERIGSAHEWLFHGDATRGKDGPLTWALQLEVLGEQSQEPLYLIRSGRLLPLLFSPGVELVVAQDILDAIGPGRGLFMAKEAKIGRLIDFSIDKGTGCDIEFGSEVARSRFFVQNYPEMRVPNVPRYFELVLSRLDDPSNLQDDCLQSDVIDLLPPEPFDRSMRIRVPVTWLHEDLLCSTGLMLVMSERIFSVIDPYLDRDFYRCARVCLAG